MKKLLCLFFLTFNLCTAFADTSDFLDQWRKENHVTSVVVLVDDMANHETHSYTSGTVTSQQNTPVTPNHLYGIGSISKTFVATELLKLQEAEKITLDQPIEKYFPEYPRWAKVTIRQLLNMTSGISNYTALEAYKKLSTTRKVISPYQLIDIAYQTQDSFPAGQGWQYSNTNYLLAGLIIEKVTNKKLTEVYQQDFLKPLNMQETFYSDSFYPSSVIKQIAHAYSQKTDITDFNASLFSSEGGMVMSSQDVLTWVKNLFLNTTVLNEESLKQLETTVAIPSMSPRPKNSRYGLGVFYTLLPYDEDLWWYTGVIDGYTSFFGFLPKQQKIIIAQAASWPEEDYSILFPNKPLIQHFLSYRKKSPENKITYLRNQLDQTDQQIVSLLQQRLTLVEQIGKVKKENNLPILDESREQAVINKIKTLCEKQGFQTEIITSIYQCIIDNSRRHEEKNDGQ